MRRQSTRLISSGYYDGEGNQTVNYEENLFKVFKTHKRRKRNSMDDGYNSMDDGYDSVDDGYDSSSKPTRFNLKIVGFLLLFLLLCLGFAWMIPTLMSSNQCSEYVQAPVTPGTGPLTYEELMEKVTALQEDIKMLKTRFKHCPEANIWPNFALESQGAFVVLGKTSKSYQTQHGTLFGIPLWTAHRPNSVIKGPTTLSPGSCWPFGGSQGHLTIALSHPVAITHVSLGHISKDISPTGTIPSAPKEFSVYGLRRLNDKGTKLGTFRYDEDGDSVQLFRMAEEQSEAFKYVELRILSNWGNPRYTCLYNFRVHGKVADTGTHARHRGIHTEAGGI